MNILSVLIKRRRVSISRITLVALERSLKGNKNRVKIALSRANPHHNHCTSSIPLRCGLCKEKKKTIRLLAELRFIEYKPSMRLHCRLNTERFGA